MLIRDVHDASRALLRVYPPADLVQRELEQVDVDDVPLVLGDLDAIADLERPAPDDERPPGEVREGVFERDRNACRDEAEERGKRLESLEPFATNDQHADREEEIGDAFAPVVARPGVRHPPVHDREHQPVENPEPRDDDDRHQQVRLHRGTQADTIG